MSTKDASVLDALDELLIEHRLGSISGDNLITDDRDEPLLTIKNVENFVISRRIGCDDRIREAIAPFIGLKDAHGNSRIKTTTHKPTTILIEDATGNPLLTIFDVVKILSAHKFADSHIAGLGPSIQKTESRTHV